MLHNSSSHTSTSKDSTLQGFQVQIYQGRVLTTLPLPPIIPCSGHGPQGETHFAPCVISTDINTIHFLQNTADSAARQQRFLHFSRHQQHSLKNTFLLSCYVPKFLAAAFHSMYIPRTHAIADVPVTLQHPMPDASSRMTLLNPDERAT